MPATEQKETFQSILGETLGEDCSLDVVQTVHEQLCALIQEHRENHDPELLTISKSTVNQVLSGCGVSQDNIQNFANRYDEAFGEDADLSPKNLVDPKHIEVKTPDVTIQVNPERSDLIKTKIIDGKKYILIRADEGVEVNGVNIHIAD